MANVLETLIKASERAACIARSCCTGSSSEALLIAEKGEREANCRFATDFKTIADVLAQESAKTEIGAKYPELAGNVRGEECSEIGGVNIVLQDTVEGTAQLLSSLIPEKAAKCMAEAAHCEIQLDILNNLPDIPELNPADLGVWIDPIDATAEFIAGVRGEGDADRGLPCVTVLIGAYLRSTGEPVIGVINQPFFNNGKGRIIWGACYNGVKESGGAEFKPKSENNTILMSAAEKPEVINKLTNLDWDVKSVPGAGHKLLKVALGEAAAYIVSKGTTFRWDTCAPHSILKARGGDLLDFTTKSPITYNDPENTDTQQYCNSGGVIAYCNIIVYEKLEKIFN